MNPAPKKIVLLGMASKIPVAGVVWQTLHYLIGFRRLGHDIYYVKEHGRTPSMFMETEEDDAEANAAAFIARLMHRFDLGDRWAFHALYDDGRCFGLSESKLKELFRSADLVINLHGGTIPLPKHYSRGQLVYLETDPVEVQIELYRGSSEVIDYLAPHRAFFSYGENYARPDCKLPVSDRFHFQATRQPVVLDFWGAESGRTGDLFTTIGNWKQEWRDIRFNGEVYHWSKHHEFLKFLDLPARTGRPFELALSSYDEEEQRMLESKGWRVRPALDLSREIDPYRTYITESRGEFTVAKDQNVRLRTGWFSDRSATYLAAGRPVITQETGFSDFLPTGEGLFGFSTIEEAIGAVESINSNYQRHREAALSIAREYFSHEVVLKQLLEGIGL